jgi:hypothetical protein
VLVWELFYFKFIKSNKIILYYLAGKVTHQRYITSARSSTVRTGFEWCPSKTPFDNSRWGFGSPNNVLNPEVIAYFFLDGRTGASRLNTFDDAPANYVLAFLCEVSNKPSVIIWHIKGILY